MKEIGELRKADSFQKYLNTVDKLNVYTNITDHTSFI